MRKVRLDGMRGPFDYENIEASGECEADVAASNAQRQAQVDAAREEPPTLPQPAEPDRDYRRVDSFSDSLRRAKANVDAFFDTNPDEFRDHMNARWADRLLILSGAELQAYRALQAAAHTAHAAQQTMATTGATLRGAIQGLCAVIAPEKP